MKTLLKILNTEEHQYLKLALVGVFTVLLFTVTKIAQENIYVQGFFERIASLGIWAPILFIAAYILMSGIFLPSIVFKISAGTLFGIAPGIIIASMAATISSLIKFLLARYFFRDAITKKIAQTRHAEKFHRIIKEDGFRMLVLLRNVPMVSSMFLNYLCGVTKMKTGHFVVASFVGRLPTTFLYVYLGYLVGLSAGIDTLHPTRITLDKILLWFGLLASVGLAYYSLYLSNKVFNEKLSETEIQT